ncbi:hypothetical protein HGA88_06565 [Candidatus Roizmanbacteria bacterium]|nr:hypothetical protein [Candidatus Roizmanbacteria bacterium]
MATNQSLKSSKTSTKPIQHLANSQKGNLPIIFGIIFLLLTVGSGVYYLGAQNNKTTTTSTSQETIPSSTPTISSANWETYKNTTYGFELKHSANSTVKTRTNGGVIPYQYIRIQNYTDQDVIKNNGRLAAGQYYLEISVYDHQLGQKSIKKCPENILNPKKVDLGAKVTGYSGKGLGGGDSASYIYAVCTTKSNVDYYIQVSENVDTFASKIIGSLKFTN